ncbi:EF-hand domain pair domain-containing protein [Ditylenchus destructor]|nr:EF-hand domain pair domain-containing protein [Ditylenchus destructor]
MRSVHLFLLLSFGLHEARGPCCGWGWPRYGLCCGMGPCSAWCCNCDGGCDPKCRKKSALNDEEEFRVSPRELFQSIDKNQDGALDEQEVKSYFNDTISENDFRSLDINSNGRIDPYEFDNELA